MAQHDRSQFIGGSDVAAILGVSPWKSPFLLYQEKVGEYREEITPEKQRVFDRGHRWEPVILDMLVDELRGRGHHVEITARNARYVDPEHSFISTEIDAELALDGEPVNVEIKSVNDFYSAPKTRGWGEPETDEIPMNHLAQTMTGLMVRPKRRTIAAPLFGIDNLRTYWVERNDDLIVTIREKIVEFWQRIQDRNPPPPSTDADVRWLYKSDSGEALDADETLIELCQSLRVAKTIAKQAKADIDELEMRIKLQMGNAATLLHGGKPIATWRNNKPSVVVNWRDAYYDLHPPADHADGFTKTKPGARPFLLKH